MSVSLRSAVMHLTSFQGYFTGDLLLRDQLEKAPLYQLDLEELTRLDKTALVPSLICLSFHNLSVIADAVPASVFRGCGLDFNRWFPAPRQAAGTVAFLRAHRRDRARHRHTLDTVRERFGLAGGVPA